MSVSYTHLVSAVIGAAFEYFCSLFQEIAFGTVSWEYSDTPLNLGGRTNIQYAVFWGLLGMISVSYTHLSDRDSMIRGLETGVVSYYFDDLSNGEIPRISSASANIPLPNLVFLGFNSEREAVSDPAVRRAVDAAVSRCLLYTSACS